MTVTEMTITFENVQNVKVRQGPVERRFDIGDVVVETAGVRAAAGPHGAASAANEAVIRGISDLEGMKARILRHVRASKTAGLGDERTHAHHDHASLPGAGAGASMWTNEHVDALRGVLAEVRAIRA
jgi:hypothetical protein